MSITGSDRKKMERNIKEIPDALGCDIEGNLLFEDDSVIVEKEHSNRAGIIEYNFCSVGKKGVVVGKNVPPNNWLIQIRFGEITISYYDIFLKKSS